MLEKAHQIEDLKTLSSWQISERDALQKRKDYLSYLRKLSKKLKCNIGGTNNCMIINEENKLEESFEHQYGEMNRHKISDDGFNSALDENSEDL